MNQIKELQPKEGVTLLAVKVPEGATSIKLMDGVSRPFISYDHDSLSTFDIIELPGCAWQLLGKATEITEEVWQTIVSKVTIFSRTYYGYILDHNLITFDTATESGMSFLEANEVYSVNPLAFDPTGTTTYEWAHNEANTGTWVILMKQND